MSRAVPAAASSRSSARAALLQFSASDGGEIEALLHERVYNTRLRVNCLLRWKLRWSHARFLAARANMIRPLSGAAPPLALWQIVDAWRELTRRARDDAIESLRRVTNPSLRRTFLVLVNRSAADGQRLAPSECGQLLVALLHWHAHKLRPRFRALLAYSVITKVFAGKVAAWAARFSCFRVLKRWAGRSSHSNRPEAVRFHRGLIARRVFERLKSTRARARFLCAACNEHLLDSAKVLVARCFQCWLEQLRRSRSALLQAATVGMKACKHWAFFEWKAFVKLLIGYKNMFIRQCRLTALNFFKRWFALSNASRVIQRNTNRAHDLYRFRSMKRTLFLWRRVAKCAALAALQQRVSSRQFMLVSFQNFRYRLFAQKALIVVEALAEKRGATSIKSHAFSQWQRSMNRRQFLRREYVRLNSSRIFAVTRSFFINFKFLLFLKKRAAQNIKFLGPLTISCWQSFLRLRFTRRLEIFRLIRYLVGLNAMHFGLRASQLPLTDADPEIWPPIVEYLRANAVRHHLGIPRQFHALVCSSNSLLNSSFQQCLRFELRLIALRVFRVMKYHANILHLRGQKLKSAAHHSFMKLAQKFFKLWLHNFLSRVKFRRGCVHLHYLYLARCFKRFVDGIKVFRLLEVEKRSAWFACTYTRITRALRKWNEFTQSAITTHVRTGRLLNKLSFRLLGLYMRIWSCFTARSVHFRSVSLKFGHFISTYRLQHVMRAWIEECRSAKLVALHMCNLGRYKTLIKAWLGWSSIAIANRSQRFRIQQADMFFRSWAFRRAVLRFKMLTQDTLCILRNLDKMKNRRHKKLLRHTLSLLRTWLYLCRVKSLQNQRALLHWKRVRFYQWISNTRASHDIKQCQLKANAHHRKSKLFKAIKSWFLFVCKLRRAQAFAALLIRHFKLHAFKSAFMLWKLFHRQQQTRTASFGQVITMRRFKLVQIHFQLWAFTTSQSVLCQSAVAMGDWIIASWGFRHWSTTARNLRKNKAIIFQFRGHHASTFARKSLLSWNVITKLSVIHRAMVFRVCLRLRRIVFQAWSKKTKLIIFAKTVRNLSDAKCVARIFRSWRGRFVYIKEVSTAIAQLGPDYASRSISFRHFDLWASEASLRKLMVYIPRRLAGWILRRSHMAWANYVRRSKSIHSKLRKVQKKRARKYTFIAFRTWRVRSAMQLCQRSCYKAYMIQLATRSLIHWQYQAKENFGKQRYINSRRKIFCNLKPSLIIACQVVAAQILSFKTCGSSEVSNIWPYAHDAMWSLLRSHILRFPYFAIIQPISTLRSRCCEYIITHDPQKSFSVAAIAKLCAQQLLKARRNFFAVLLEMQRVYDPIACATSSVSRPRPLAGTAEKAAAAMFCTHICVTVIFKWRLLCCYNRVRQQRLEVALTFFSMNHQNTFMKAWRRFSWASKVAGQHCTAVLILRALRYQRTTLLSLQEYAINSRILNSKFEIVRIANSASIKRNAFQWWCYSNRRGKILYQLHCNRHLREYVYEPFRLWSQAVKSHKRLLSVHCDLVALTCSRYAPHAAPTLHTSAVASASQSFRSTHAFWLDNPYIPFLRLCGITRAFSLWRDVCSALRFLDAKAGCVLNFRKSSAIRKLKEKTLEVCALKFNLKDFSMIKRIRRLRLCVAEWRVLTKFRLRSAISVDRSLGTEICRAILFWAIKFCNPPPIHINWWTLYPKFRVYGTSAILSRTAKFIAFMRFTRWRRAVIDSRFCVSQAAVLQQSHLTAFLYRHFASWLQAHHAQRVGLKSIKSFYIQKFRSKVLVQARLKSLVFVVNSRLLSSAIDYFALAVFTKDSANLFKISHKVASRFARFFVWENEFVPSRRLQKFILRKMLRSIMLSWNFLVHICRKREALYLCHYFSSWCSFVHCAQRYREQANRRHEQLQRLCSISQRVDKRCKCLHLRHLHSLCRDRRNIVAAVASASSRFRLLRCIRYLHSVSRRNANILRATSGLLLKSNFSVLQRILYAWKQLILIKAHRHVWDARDSDSAFQNWFLNAADIKRRRMSLENLSRRISFVLLKCYFSALKGVVDSCRQKASAGENFLKHRVALRLRQVFITWHFSVFCKRRVSLLLSSIWFSWSNAVAIRNHRISFLRDLYDRNVNRILSPLIAKWREWVSFRMRRRLMCRKIEFKYSQSIKSRSFSFWSAAAIQNVLKTKQKSQDAFLFRAEVLLRAFYLRWRHVIFISSENVQKSLSSMMRNCLARFFSNWAARVTAKIIHRLKNTACTALASRNAVLASFRLWRLFAFSHSHLQGRHIQAPSVASTFAQSGRELLSSMSVSQRTRVLMLPRLLQVAFVWFSHRVQRNFQRSSSSSVFKVESRIIDRSSNDAKSPSLSMSQLFTSQASVSPAARRLDSSLEWHRPTFEAKTSFDFKADSSRLAPEYRAETPRVRIARFQHMLEELYGTTSSP